MAAPPPLPPLQRNARSLSVAYACFVFCGLYVLAGDMMEAGFAGDISVFIGLWLAALGLAGVVALVCGTVLALKAPRHPPLLALCLTNVVFIGLWLAALGLAGVVALVCGTVLALKAPRHPPLLALCLTNVLFIAAVIAMLAMEGPLKANLEPTVKVASWIYLALSILIPLWWFLIGKPRGGQL
jgi:hypothetical protein